ncbi:hypothetical protein BaRGS_00035933, partial [Batillaria attramentaria]
REGPAYDQIFLKVCAQETAQRNSDHGKYRAEREVSENLQTAKMEFGGQTFVTQLWLACGSNRSEVTGITDGFLPRLSGFCVCFEDARTLPLGVGVDGCRGEA